MRGTIGAGIKLDVYPWFTKKMLEAEIEAFGLGGSVRAPWTTSGTGTTQAQGNLIAVTTMYILMLRYPVKTVHPYIGVGAGSSTGILYNANIQSGSVGLLKTTGGSRVCLPISRRGAGLRDEATVSLRRVQIFCDQV